MALSEGLKGFVDFFTKSFNDRGDEDVFNFENGIDEYNNDVDGTLALDTMYGTRVKPERSFEREAKVVSHPNTYKSGEVSVIEPRSFSESAQIVKKLIDKKTVVLPESMDRRTFEAAAWLKRAGADTAEVKKMFKFIFN